MTFPSQHRLKRVWSAILPCFVGISSLADAASPTYREDILPLFKEHCLSCHNPDKKKADLDLSSMQGLQIGSSGGEVVKVGVPDTSVLYMVINHHEDYEAMPPKEPKLPEKDIALIRQWILDGMVESTGGKSMLREITFDVSKVTSLQPEGPPPMPENLPVIPQTPTNRPPAITALATSPWAPLVAVSGNEQILLHHKESREVLGILPFPEGGINVLKFSRNGSLLLAAGGRGAASGRVVLFDVKTGKRVAEIGDEQDAVLAADISADHRFVALGGPTKIVKVFDASTGEMRHRIDKHTDWITSIAFAPETDQFASADRNGGIHLWEAEKGGIIYSLDEHKVRVTGLSWRADGKMLASGADDGKLVIWDMKDGWPAKVVDAHIGKTDIRHTRATGILSVAWARQGELVTTGRDRRVKFWKPDGASSSQSSPLEGLPTAAGFDSNGTHAWIGTIGGRLMNFDLKGVEAAPTAAR